jgi:D-3-phosphoglycerate dehydrogenase
MRVLIADTFEQSGLDGLTRAGCDVVYDPDAEGDRLVAAIRESQANVLIVRSTQVGEAMLDAGPLSLVVRAGAGVNTIDVAGASRRGIYVSNCPGRNAIAVAELVFGLILSIDRRIPENVEALRAGRWNKKEFSKSRGLFGRTIGLLGFGSIAQEVARRAKAFGMPLVVWSRRFGRDAEARMAAVEDFGVEVVSSPANLMDRADIVSVHHAALESVVREKGVRVGLDVFAKEPGTSAGGFDDPMVALPTVYGTHHIGASTEQAQEAIAAEAVRIVRTFVETGRVPNVVNLASQTAATHMLVVRHRDRPGVLAHVFERLRDGGFNVQETENIIFEGGQAAIARINLDGEPSPPTIDAIASGSRDILDLQLVKLR